MKGAGIYRCFLGGFKLRLEDGDLWWYRDMLIGYVVVRSGEHLVWVHAEDTNHRRPLLLSNYDGYDLMTKYYVEIAHDYYTGA
jgi:hypothetical protein